jgi:hypothetical protein
MADTPSFGKLVPGFDFLQGMMKNASAGMPVVSQWIAPTLDPAELDKRIQDLKTVQFWLEQNARLLGTTIQALEVQRMTLATLKTMNLPLADLQASMQLRPPETAAAAAPGIGAVDPMQWWTALTQQFGDIAAKALKEAPDTVPAAAPVKVARKRAR